MREASAVNGLYGNSFSSFLKGPLACCQSGGVCNAKLSPHLNKAWSRPSAEVVLTYSSYLSAASRYFPSAKARFALSSRAAAGDGGSLGGGVVSSAGAIVVPTTGDNVGGGCGGTLMCFWHPERTVHRMTKVMRFGRI